jgi:SAM-dependent methyltransferase
LAASLLRWLLAHPLTAALDLDDPATTELRREIIASKPFLQAIYDEWYTMLAAAVPPGEGHVLELGSGAGYCADFIPNLITSEVFRCKGVEMVVNAERLPFSAETLRAIVMTNVLHHLPDVRAFFREAVRCLRPGGKILMIEPWITPWSRFVYSHFHHEPIDPNAKDWTFPSSGPLSGANEALPWIVFERDRAKFGREFPLLRIEKVQPFLPFRYIVSGGVGMRSLMPGFTYDAWVRLENALQPHMKKMGMFAFISLIKGPSSSSKS